MTHLAPNLRVLLERPSESRKVGPFLLIERLGTGGFAPVWLARETYGATQLRTAAVKLFSLEDGIGDDTRKRDRIVEEARALCRVEHPNVVRFYALPIEEEARVIGVAMEHVAGTSLDAKLAADGALGVRASLEVGIAIASALTAVHRAGLVHRDVKPANVIEAGGVYKLIDFGIAAADVLDARPSPENVSELQDLPEAMRGAKLSTLDRDGAEAERSGEVTVQLAGRWGTVGYVDPVCVSRGATATVASDLYALGALLFECVCGKLPASAASSQAHTLSGQVLDGRRRAPSLGEVEPSAPPALSRLVDGLLDPERARRPSSAEWVATELERIKTELSGIRRALPAEAVGPFRGLGRFDESDHDVYFGRANEIAATLHTLRGHGLVAIIGPSGSGKSSLARAGVLPAIAGGALSGWPKRWDTAVSEPGPDPRASILRALSPFLPADALKTAGAIVPALASRAQATGFGLILAVDQLEELATVASGESLAFAAELLTHIGEQATPGVRGLVTLRRDMLDGVLALGGLGKAIVRGSVLIEPINDLAWGDVLDQALSAYGYTFEDDGVREDVLEELRGTSGAMPLAQFALTELWNSRDTQKKKITRASLHALGGLAGALERHAETTLAELERTAPEAAASARPVLLALTTPLGTRAARTLAELVAAAGKAAPDVVRALETGRLVQWNGDRVTLAHEALLAQWGRLNAWVAEAREDRLLVDELERDATRWASDADAVPLWQRRRLLHGEELRRRAVVLTVNAQSFLAASRRAERRARVIVGSSALAVVLSMAVGAAAYLHRNREAFLREQADRRAAEEQTRQVVAKQAEIDRLLGELEDSRTKRQIMALKEEITGPQPPAPRSAAPPPRTVSMVRPVVAEDEKRPPEKEPDPPEPAIKVQKQW